MNTEAFSTQEKRVDLSQEPNCLRGTEKNIYSTFS